MVKQFTDPTLRSSDITPESSYLNRRQFMKNAVGGSAALLAAQPLAVNALELGSFDSYIPAAKSGWPVQAPDVLTPFEDVTSYNNFYEFGMDKSDPARYASAMTLEPWSIRVSSDGGKTADVQFEDLLRTMDVEERIYRLRCVEAWSMVIPWLGFPLAELIRWLDPQGQYRFVQFQTRYTRGEMRGTRSFSSVIDWPYQEALRMDEAMNPLSFMAVGLYGKSLPAQNGAPLRLVVPWKYGFKSIKSIAGIHFTNRQPQTSWQSIASHEYGFYANVNPEVDHPRWSQRYERRLPSSLFSPNRIPTQMFNGYGEYVADLYKNLDLRRYY
jgi:sulfoxide reductase catalytic subunit YedY